ncbi:ATP-binding cassette domain-containing protein [Thiotrichales bacterium 19S3-7]|nr:ATP-binding cassette domain-containing protein [Thiotrichales bacterium 19S3-7]MCF6802747.1 ATP-binding cassette domain-containing protein [Thiotrichales bacterium 19S3-11]
MIEITNLKKTYMSKYGTQTALNGINLSIQKGDIFGIIGKSGAGKSTLIRTLNLLEKPTSGQITINNTEITTLNASKLRELRQRIGMIFQHFNLFSSRDVYRNIAYPLEIANVNKNKIHQRVTQLIDLVSLNEQTHYYPEQLSGGQKQRVAIARALACEPDILLSDEATSALDPDTTRQILKLLKKINAELKITVVLITHEMEVVRDICKHVAIIDHGVIAESGNVIDVFTNPQTDIAKILTENTMKLSLPDDLRHKLAHSDEENLTPVLKLTFLGHSASEPIIATLAKQFNVIANLIQANIEPIQNQTIGISICHLLGDKQNITQALAYITQQQIKIEVLGYAQANAF